MTLRRRISAPGQVPANALAGSVRFPVSVDAGGGQRLPYFATMDDIRNWLISQAVFQRDWTETEADGTATWVFPTPYAEGVIPIVHAYPVSSDPLPYLPVTLELDNTHIKVRLVHLTNLPVLSPVSGLLGAVITGINVVVSALSGFQVGGNSNVADVPVHFWAAKPLGS